jgi:hypothetical protein
MVKEYFGTYKFPFKWEQVAAGFWVKYPNPYSNHVLSEDVVSRYVTDDNVLVTKRLLVKERNFHTPKWAERFVTLNHVYVMEETHCDPEKKTLTSFTRNFSLTSMMVISFPLLVLSKKYNDCFDYIPVNCVLCCYTNQLTIL